MSSMSMELMVISTMKKINEIKELQNRGKEGIINDSERRPEATMGEEKENDSHCELLI